MRETPSKKSEVVYEPLLLRLTIALLVTTQRARRGSREPIFDARFPRNVPFTAGVMMKQEGTSAERNCPVKVLIPKRNVKQKVRKTPQNIPEKGKGVVQLPKSCSPALFHSFSPEISNTISNPIPNILSTTRICGHGYAKITKQEFHSSLGGRGMW